MILDWLPNLLAAWSIQAVGVMSPGPGVALILGIATARGRASALAACLGIGLVAIFWASVTVLGFAALLADAERVMMAIRVMGAAYLAYLAFGSFRRAMTPPPPPAPARVSARRSIIEGAAMQLTNPKAIFFWIAVAALGGLETAPLSILLFFIAGAFFISFLGHGAWAIVLSSAPFRSLYARARRGIEATLGAVFGVAAYKLLTVRT